MKVLQAISFLALMLGAGGIENQKGDYQSIAIGMTIIALVITLITSRKECVWTRHYQNLNP